MIVTNISQQKKNTSRFNLEVNGLFVSGISSNTLAKENLYKGKTITQEDVDRIVKEDLQERFFNRCAEYLGRGIKTEYQIKQYIRKIFLQKKGDWFDTELDMESLQEFVLLKLREYGYVNDEVYARSFVASRMRSKPRSKSFLVSELMSKGVSKDLAYSVCEEEVEDEFKMISDLYNKKYGEDSFNLYTDTKKVNYLRGKGFNWDLIKQLSEYVSRE